MPRFFFDFTTDGQADPDGEGIVLRDVAAARAEAAQCFGEMIRCSSAAMPSRLTLAVRDEAGRAITTASFHMSAETGL